MPSGRLLDRTLPEKMPPAGVEHGPPPVDWTAYAPTKKEWGIHFRRDSHANAADWMRGCASFVNEICLQWELPGRNTKSCTGALSRPINIHIPVCIDKPPPLPEHGDDQRWQSDTNRLWIQIDCEVLAELLAGRAFLDTDDRRPVFIRLARFLCQLHSLGLKPVRDRMDYIMWAPREFNIVADHAVNATMDAGESWDRAGTWPFICRTRQQFNLRLCVDGGL